MGSSSLEEFGDRFMDILPRLMREFNTYESKYITSGQITPMQLTVLECLSRNNQCEMCCISKALDISFSTATGMMDRLVKHGFVARAHSEDDRRKVIVTITAKGRRIMKEINQHKRAGLIKMFSSLSDAERSRYLEILEKIVKNFSSVKGA